MNHLRICKLRGGDIVPGPVLYWMSRDQRAQDNWALLHAQQEALARQAPLRVIFILAPDFLHAQPAQVRFMLDGLQETACQLATKAIPLILLTGDPPTTLARYLAANACSLLVTDFDPLKIKRQWKTELLSATRLPVDEVDAHNLVPCWEASPKQEFGAYTLRPKLHRRLPEFTESFPELLRHPFDGAAELAAGPQDIWQKLDLPELPAHSYRWKAGPTAALGALRRFLGEGLERYGEARNDPSRDGQSDLSPYLHFGQLAAQRVFLAVLQSGALQDSQNAFLEELVVRRELADNFCYYNENYDNSKGFPAWSQETLEKHRDDRRPYRYGPEAMECALTHDPAWNAAQRQLLQTGKMHGYMRMYWAKKILEWSADPETAMATAIQLNNRYSLDGRDPNGYAGIAWSIGGVHDRPWGERPVFGKIRYMNYAGLTRKFKNLAAYIARY